MQNSFVKLLFATIVILGLFGCEGANEDALKPEVPDVVKGRIGDIYTLKSVFYANNVVVTPGAQDFFLKLDDTDLIKGKIICNEFVTNVEWTEDAFLILTNWQKENKSDCKGVTEPLQLQMKMKYTFIANGLVLEDPAGQWSAIFLLKN